MERCSMNFLKSLTPMCTYNRYYFHLPFQETVRRHYTKQQTDFDETAMSKWFVPADTLNVQGEKYITESMTEDYIINMIFKDIGVL